MEQLQQGESKEVWYGFNVSGRLYYSVRTRSGANQVRAFWRTWGIGKERETQRLQGDGYLDIPIALFRGVLAAKLRVEAREDTALEIRENATANTVTFSWP